MRRLSRGDTIIEVLISVAIVSLGLSGAYVLGGRALKSSLSTNQRVEALAVAESQANILKFEHARHTDANGNHPVFDSYFRDGFNAANTFCLPYPAGTSFDNLRPKTALDCEKFNGGIYTVKITYKDADLTYSIVVSWPSLSGGPSNTQELAITIPRDNSYQ